MSTASAAGREWWPTLGHYAWKLDIGIAIAIAALAFTDNRTMAVLRAILTGVYLGLIFPQRDHDRHLCERCAGDFPLDPQREIVKHRRALRLTHAVADHHRRTMYIAMGVMVVAVLAVGMFLPKSLLPYWSVMVWGVFGVGFTWTFQQHKRLQPWCPQCRGRGRGKDTFNPDPVPAPSRELTS
jgi:hypothetical protein